MGCPGLYLTVVCYSVLLWAVLGIQVIQVVQVVQVGRMISLGDMHSENIWYSWSKSSIIEKSWDVTPVTKGRTEDGKWKIEQCSILSEFLSLPQPNMRTIFEIWFRHFLLYVRFSIIIRLENQMKIRWQSTAWSPLLSWSAAGQPSFLGLRPHPLL